MLTQNFKIFWTKNDTAYNKIFDILKHESRRSNGPRQFCILINLPKTKCDSASLFLCDNESKFVLCSNYSFKCTGGVTTKPKTGCEKQGSPGRRYRLDCVKKSIDR